MSRFGRSRLRDAAYAATWAITPEKLEAVLEFLDERAEGRTMSKADLRARGIKAARPGIFDQPVGQQIAVLPLRGVIAHHAGMEMEISGGTSTEAFGRSFDNAMSNASVSAIVINADSPGGAVEGVPELFAKVFAARGKGREIIAVCNAHMHSAAYWICAAADTIVVTPSGAIGDIGVMTVHTDTSKMEAEAGIKRTLIKAGAHKGEGVPFEPLSDEDRASIQARVDDCYSLFVADVAKGRGDSVANVKAGYGEGRSLSAKAAVAAGLADRVATMEQVIAELGGQSQGGDQSRRVAAISAAAKLADDTGGRVVMLNDASGNAVAAVVPADGEITCPDCGAPVELEDGEYVCPECDGTPVTDASAELIRIAASAADAVTLIHADSRATLTAAATPSTLVASAARIETIPITAPKESVMTPEEKEAVLKALRDAETARVNAIRALCTDHKMSAKADEFINGGLALDAVRAAILDEHQKLRAATPIVNGVHDRAADRPFESLGHQLQAIAHVGMGTADGTTIGRLHAAVTTGGASANVGADGAFQIQKEFATELLESTIDGGDLLGQADTHEVGANADGLEVVYLDETSRATGSRFGGVQVYRGAEADVATAKKPKLGKWEVRLEDIIGLAYMTERLLQDASSIQNVFEQGFMAEFRFVAEDEMVRGTGTGQMYGILNAPGTVSVAKETGQIADTIVAENIGKMWRSVHPRSRTKGAWYYNPELENQFDQLQIGTGTSAQLVYMPPGGLSGAKFGTIKGRPAIPLEYASGAGDVGDFFFADWSRYKIITKGGLQSADSIHVGFTKNERTFRWLTRINGAPKDKSAITPYKATDTNFKMSPFVTLAAR